MHGLHFWHTVRTVAQFAIIIHRFFRVGVRGTASVPLFVVDDNFPRLYDTSNLITIVNRETIYHPF